MSEVVTRKKAVWFVHEILSEQEEALERNDIPVAYVHGVPNQMFPQIERALKGHRVGDEVVVTLTPEEHGFRILDPDFEKVFSPHEVPPEYRHIGAEADFQDAESGEVGVMQVQRIAPDGSIVFMKKHPFADLTLTYRITITDIREATAEEVRAGHPVMDHPHLPS